MVDFAQKLIDDDIVTDVEALEKLAGQAALSAKKGAPPSDPFVAADDLVADNIPVPEKKAVAGPVPASMAARQAPARMALMADSAPDTLKRMLRGKLRSRIKNPATRVGSMSPR